MLEKNAEKLRQRLARVPKNARGRRKYDEKLRHEAVELIRTWRGAGRARSQLAKKLGLHDSTLAYWEGKRRPEARRVRRVEMAPVHSARRFTLTLPSGAQIGGLELEDVIALARLSR